MRGANTRTKETTPSRPRSQLAMRCCKTRHTAKGRRHHGGIRSAMSDDRNCCRSKTRVKLDSRAQLRQRRPPRRLTSSVGGAESRGLERWRIERISLRIRSRWRRRAPPPSPSAAAGRAAAASGPRLRKACVCSQSSTSSTEQWASSPAAARGGAARGGRRRGGARRRRLEHARRRVAPHKGASSDAAAAAGAGAPAAGGAPARERARAPARAPAPSPSPG